MRVLEDPSNKLVYLQLEKENSQGAICVYNNGRRVAAGVLSPETLKSARRVQIEDLVADVNQLLAPPAGVVVTPVAYRHLTALLNQCKENTMATKKTASAEPKSTKKFVSAPAPAKSAAKKTAKPASAAKEASAPTERKSNFFRLLNDGKPTWSAFTGQKGIIIAAFVKLAAVGAKARGVTRSQLIAALPDVPPKNISFYLSTWQKDSLLEKLAAE